MEQSALWFSGGINVQAVGANTPNAVSNANGLDVFFDAIGFSRIVLAPLYRMVSTSQKAAFQRLSVMGVNMSLLWMVQAQVLSPSPSMSLPMSTR